MDFSQLVPEEKQLMARLEDLIRMAGKGDGCKFSSFLNERQIALAEELIRRRQPEGCLFYGGYPDAVRQVLGVFPAYQEPEGAAFPVEVVAVHLPKGAKPSHRDVLGSLMSLGIKRESVGDILIADRRCDVFALEPVAQLIVGELRKIGGYGVRCETGVAGEFQRTEAFQPLRGTIHSPRLDALVALLTGLAREKSAALIKSDLVQHNHQTATSRSQAFGPGDMITIRKYGKYIVDEIGNPTKKGRLPVLCRKYL